MPLARIGAEQTTSSREAIVSSCRPRTACSAIGRHLGGAVIREKSIGAGAGGASEQAGPVHRGGKGFDPSGLVG
jgi:hypothetical protein